MKEWQEKACLEFDPFEGDFGDGEVGLKNVIVKRGRKEYECHTCGAKIPKGATQRVLVEADSEAMHTYRFCEKCCKAMAYWVKYDLDTPYEVRVGLHRNEN